MVEKVKKETSKKVLVTGSSGMLGIDLCIELSKHYEVIGLDRRRTKDEGRRTKFVECDITNQVALKKNITEINPSIIVHSAAWTDVDGCEKDPKKAILINATSVSHLAEISKKTNIPVVYISTDFVFDGKKTKPYTEKDQPDPISAYGESKLSGEESIEICEKYFILRTGWLYGKNGPNFIRAILNKYEKSGKTLDVVDDQIGCPTYTKDLAEAISVLIRRTMDGSTLRQAQGRPEQSRGTTSSPSLKSSRAKSRDDGRWMSGIYHIANSGKTSWYNYAKEIFKMLNIRDAKIVPIKSSELGRPAKRPAYSVLNCEKFENLVEYKMRNWTKALEEYLK